MTDDTNKDPMENKSLEAAIEKYKEQINRNPDDGLLHFQLACAHEEKFDLPLAESHFHQAGKLLPDSFDILYKLASVYLLQGKNDLAFNSFLRCLQLRPDSGKVIYNLGQIAYQRKDWKTAINCFEAADGMHGTDLPDVSYMLGMSYRSAGRWLDAIMPLEDAASQNENQPDIHFNLADVCLRLGRHEQAEKEYRLALSLCPDNILFMFGLGRACFMRGNHADAGKILNRILVLDPANLSAKWLLNAMHGRKVKSIPGKILADIFDSWSENYDDYHLNELNYSLPQKLCNLLKGATANHEFSNALDMGCGTGLAGEIFKPCCENIVGIDISAGMLEIAAGKNIYSRLFEGNIIDILIPEYKRAFDLFITAEVFIYVGDLTPIFERVAEHATPGAYWAFSVEIAADTTDYVLTRTGLFAHSEDYIGLLANQYGFRICEAKPAECRNFGAMKIYILKYQG